MGNQLCCGGSCGRPSACQRRNETALESKPRDAGRARRRTVMLTEGCTLTRQERRKEGCFRQGNEKSEKRRKERRKDEEEPDLMEHGREFDAAEHVPHVGSLWVSPSRLSRHPRGTVGSQKSQPSKQQQQQQPPPPPRPPKQQPQRQQWQQCHRLKNDTKGPKIPRRLCEWASDLRQPCRNQPGPSTSAPHCNSEDSSVHYADILVYNQTRSRTVQQVKEMQIENATEYATLRFPEPTPRYHSKNGTLV